MHIRILAALVLLVAHALTATPVAAQSTGDAPLVIEELECRGNTGTSCAYILSYLYLSAGSEVDEEEIRNARFRLSALPNFSSVRTFLEKGSARGKVKLVVEVAEASPLFSEALAGLANNRASVLALRIGHQNLFGAGERLELTASARIPMDGPVERESQHLRLQYVDPTLFGFERYFFSAGVAYFRNRFETSADDLLDAHETGADFLVGRRFADFSYFALGYRYLVTGDFESRVFTGEDVIEVEESQFTHQLLLDYGWNSEDDPYFPTQGGRFRASLIVSRIDSSFSNAPDFNPDADIEGRFVLGYRHTWNLAGSNYLRLSVGAAPGTESRTTLDEEADLVTLGYERDLPATGLFAGIERGRWYVDAKYVSFAISSSGGSFQEFGVKAGVRLDTRQFGIVELYLLATTER
jgi:outer membrane translocation and assembly module TamA